MYIVPANFTQIKDPNISYGYFIQITIMVCICCIIVDCIFKYIDNCFKSELIQLHKRINTIEDKYIKNNIQIYNKFIDFENHIITNIDKAIENHNHLKYKSELYEIHNTIHSILDMVNINNEINININNETKKELTNLIENKYNKIALMEETFSSYEKKFQLMKLSIVETEERCNDLLQYINNSNNYYSVINSNKFNRKVDPFTFGFDINNK